MTIDFMDVGLKILKESTARELTSKEQKMYTKLTEWEGVALSKQTEVGVADESIDIQSDM